MKLKIEQDVLIALLKKQDRTGFNYLYDAYSGALFGVINRIVQNPEMAEEALSDVFVKIWKNIDTYDSTKGSLYTWMLNIARNTSLDLIKSKGYIIQSQNQSLENIVYENQQTSVSPAPISQWSKEDVLKVLDEDKRELLRQAYFEGFTQAEIAERNGIPLGTVKTKIRSALQQLRQIFKDY